MKRPKPRPSLKPKRTRPQRYPPATLPSTDVLDTNAARIIRAYVKAGSLRGAGAALGMSHARVWQIIRTTAPHLMQPRGASRKIIPARTVSKTMEHSS